MAASSPRLACKTRGRPQFIILPYRRVEEHPRHRNLLQGREAFLAELRNYVPVRPGNYGSPKRRCFILVPGAKSQGRKDPLGPAAGVGVLFQVRITLHHTHKNTPKKTGSTDFHFPGPRTVKKGGSFLKKYPPKFLITTINFFTAKKIIFGHVIDKKNLSRG